MACPGPLRAFFERVRARRGHSVAIVAVARKLAVLFWYLLTTGQDYAYSMPTATAKKLCNVELKAGAPPRKGGGSHHPLTREQRRQLERRSAEHAENAYRRNIADWQTANATNSASLTAAGRPARRGTGSSEAK